MPEFIDLSRVIVHRTQVRPGHPPVPRHAIPNPDALGTASPVRAVAVFA